MRHSMAHFTPRQPGLQRTGIPRQACLLIRELPNRRAVLGRQLINIWKGIDDVLASPPTPLLALGRLRQGEHLGRHRRAWISPRETQAKQHCRFWLSNWSKQYMTAYFINAGANRVPN